MRWPLWCTLTACVAAVLPSQSAEADQVYRSTAEKPVVGDVTEITKDSLTVTPKVGDPTTIPASEVTMVRWDAAPLDLVTAINDEQKGRFDDALTKYREMLSGGEVSDEKVRTDVEFLVARTLKKQAEADPEKLDAAIQELEGFTRQHDDSFRYFQAISLLGEAYRAQENYAKAQEVYNQLKTSQSNDYQLAARVALANLKLDQDQVDAALADFEAVASAPANSPAERARLYEALLGKAECLYLEEQYDPALKTLDEVVMQVSPSNARLQSEAFLRKGDCYRAMQQPKQALIEYLKVDVLFSGQPSQHSQALLHLSELWKAVGQTARGDDARRRLLENYENSPAAEKLRG